MCRRPFYSIEEDRSASNKVHKYDVMSRGLRHRQGHLRHPRRRRQQAQKKRFSNFAIFGPSRKQFLQLDQKLEQFLHLPATGVCNGMRVFSLMTQTFVLCLFCRRGKHAGK
jgi:hypothetical protein